MSSNMGCGEAIEVYLVAGVVLVISIKVVGPLAAGLGKQAACLLPIVWGIAVGLWSRTWNADRQSYYRPKPQRKRRRP